MYLWAGKPKLGFKDQHELKTLPARIEALQTKIAGFNAILADPDLYSRNPRRFDGTTQALAAARDELAAAEEKWLSLEMLREEIDYESASDRDPIADTHKGLYKP